MKIRQTIWINAPLVAQKIRKKYTLPHPLFLEAKDIIKPIALKRTKNKRYNMGRIEYLQKHNKPTKHKSFAGEYAFL